MNRRLPMVNKEAELEAIITTSHLESFVEKLYLAYGQDFRNYSLSSLKRRIICRMHAEQLNSFSVFEKKVFTDDRFLADLLSDFSINVTEMFRDPSFFLAFRKKVVPLLRTYPTIRIWHAGCSTGEEVYSMAILLQEEGLYERSRIYATDMNEEVIKHAKAGKYPLEKMKQYTRNYIIAGGSESFSDYYTANDYFVIFDSSLSRNVVFGQHNLVTDASFNEFNVILCRNVLIYFNQTLKDHVHDLFHRSLCNLGILGLGKRESIKFTAFSEHYEQLDSHETLYKKVK